MKTTKLLKILSSETKAKLIAKLYTCNDKDTVNDLCKQFGLKQSNVSKHLTDLRDEGIVDFVKQGKESYYLINEKWLKTNKIILDAVIKHAHDNEFVPKACQICKLNG